MDIKYLSEMLELCQDVEKRPKITQQIGRIKLKS